MILSRYRTLKAGDEIMKIRKSFIRPKGAHCAPLQMLNDICTDQRTINDRPYKISLTSTNKKCRRAKAEFCTVLS